MDFEGSKQIGYLNEFINQFDWWAFKPANDLLIEQPGDDKFDEFIAVVAKEDHSTILVYSPVKQVIKLYNLNKDLYQIRWFNPITNTYSDGTINAEGSTLEIENTMDHDMVLIVEKIDQ